MLRKLELPRKALRSCTAVLPILLLTSAACTAAPAPSPGAAAAAAPGPASPASARAATEPAPAPDGAADRAPDLAADLAAIEELHRRDEAAARTLDVPALARLWTDDIVALPPGHPPVVGRDENISFAYGQTAGMRGVEILDYDLELEEVRVVGDHAFEWGRLIARVQPPGGGEPVESDFNVMRVLRRGEDGAWRVARTTWNSRSPEE